MDVEIYEVPAEFASFWKLPTETILRINVGGIQQAGRIVGRMIEIYDTIKYDTISESSVAHILVLDNYNELGFEVREISGERFGWYSEIFGLVPISDVEVKRWFSRDRQEGTITRHYSEGRTADPLPQWLYCPAKGYGTFYAFDMASGRCEKWHTYPVDLKDIDADPLLPQRLPDF